MLLLVTGGAGYVGSHVVQHLLARGDVVVVADRRPGPSAIDAATLVAGDLGERSFVERLFDGHRFDAVLHFAASKSVSEAVDHPGRYFANNVGATALLLEAMERGGIDRFVFSSSCAVYGIPTSLPVTEDAPLRPTTPYGASKRMVEEMLEWSARGTGLRSVSLRYFNAAGAALDASNGESWDAAANLLPIIMRALLGSGPPLQLHGTDYDTPDGTAIRDYVHVDDLARAHLDALDALDVRPPGALVLNLGRGVGTSVREVIDAVERITGRSVPVDEVARRPGDAPAVYADPSRARAELGWHAEHDLDVIVDSAWRWYSRAVMPEPA
jgi:UDP-glucose-4-epimerase GalE